MSSWNFILSWVEHEKSFITSGPVAFLQKGLGKQGRPIQKQSDQGQITKYHHFIWEQKERSVQNFRTFTLYH